MLHLDLTLSPLLNMRVIPWPQYGFVLIINVIHPYVQGLNRFIFILQLSLWIHLIMCSLLILPQSSFRPVVDQVQSHSLLELPRWTPAHGDGDWWWWWLWMFSQWWYNSQNVLNIGLPSADGDGDSGNSWSVMVRVNVWGLAPSAPSSPQPPRTPWQGNSCQNNLSSVLKRTISMSTWQGRHQREGRPHQGWGLGQAEQGRQVELATRRGGEHPTYLQTPVASIYCNSSFNLLWEYQLFCGLSYYRRGPVDQMRDFWVLDVGSCVVQRALEKMGNNTQPGPQAGRRQGRMS